MSSVDISSPTSSLPIIQYPPSVAKVGVGLALAVAAIMLLMAFKAPRVDVERTMATISVSATGILPLQDASLAIN